MFEKLTNILSVVTLNDGRLKYYNYKSSSVLPKCLFSRDVIIIVTPLPGAVTITT